MKYVLVILLFFLGCDLDISDSSLSSNSYAINTEVVIKSNAANFPITSALVKMEWTLDYHSSNRDSAYTDSNGEVNIQTQIDNVYSYQSQTPQIIFYIYEKHALGDKSMSCTGRFPKTLFNEHADIVFSRAFFSRVPLHVALTFLACMLKNGTLSCIILYIQMRRLYLANDFVLFQEGISPYLSALPKHIVSPGAL